MLDFLGLPSPVYQAGLNVNAFLAQHSKVQHGISRIIFVLQSDTALNALESEYKTWFWFHNLGWLLKQCKNFTISILFLLVAMGYTLSHKSIPHIINI